MSISPNVPGPQDSYHYENTGTPRWIAVLFGVLFVALAAMGFFGYTSQSRMSQELAKAQDQNKTLSAQLAQANSSLADLKGHIEVTEQKIGAVATDLGGAKKDIETTRNDLEATKGKLERAQGDMGVMSGLIAHNHDDLEDLKRRGDRNYYEFTVAKTKTAQRVGPVQITLNKVDPKKSRYTMTVFVDDRSIEKRDKTAGEPVQFYVKGGRGAAPYEMVVFDVGKSQITGYLSTPKDAGTGGSAATPTAAPAT